MSTNQSKMQDLISTDVAGVGADSTTTAALAKPTPPVTTTAAAMIVTATPPSATTATAAAGTAIGATTSIHSNNATIGTAEVPTADVPQNIANEMIAGIIPEEQLTKEERKAFQEFIKTLSEVKLTIEGDRKPPAPYFDDIDESRKASIDEFHNWFRVERYLVQILELLIHKKMFGYSGSFLRLIISGETRDGTKVEAIDLFLILQKQPDTFFRDNGQFLLMLCLWNGSVDIVKYLVKEKEISPNFDLNYRGITTPLIYLVQLGYDINAEKMCELVTLFHTKECDLNKVDSDSNLPLKMAVLAHKDGGSHTECIKRLLALGANPFLHCKQKFQNSSVLFDAYQCRLEQDVEILLSYGSALVKPIFRFGSGVESSSLQDLHHLPHCSLAAINNNEIIFKSFKGNTWIYSIQNLKEMLESSDVASDAEKQRLNMVCKFVLDVSKTDPTDPTIFVDGVVEAFKHYYARKLDTLLEYKKFVRNDLAPTVFDYLGEDSLFRKSLFELAFPRSDTPVSPPTTVTTTATAAAKPK